MTKIKMLATIIAVSGDRPDQSQGSNCNWPV